MNKKIKLASKYTCSGCLACIDSCSVGAIELSVGADGHFYPRVNEQQCIQCGKCMKVCPVVSGMRYKSEEKLSKPLSAWSTDDELRMRSTSGGVFAALSKYVISQGGFVVGVELENSYAKHIVISNQEDICRLQGSKYQQSNTVGIYKQVRKLLQADKIVLFSGTGCQVAGLLSYLGTKQYDNLITLDLVCGGVPSRLLVDRFLLESAETEIISYRDKMHGWRGEYHLSVLKNGYKERDPQLHELIINGYAAGITNRYSCFDCKFNGISRKSDLTIADFWGEPDFPAEHYKGVSLVIAHSAKGKELLSISDLKINPTTWHKAVRKNPRIVVGKVLFAKHGLSHHLLPFLFKHLSTKKLMAIYANKYIPLWLLPMKVLRFAKWKANVMYQEYHVNRFLRNIL